LAASRFVVHESKQSATKQPPHSGSDRYLIARLALRQTRVPDAQIVFPPAGFDLKKLDASALAVSASSHISRPPPAACFSFCVVRQRLANHYSVVASNSGDILSRLKCQSDVRYASESGHVRRKT
jgi:hypothetical protein